MKSLPRVVPVLAVLAGAAIGASSGLYIKTATLSSLALGAFRMGVPFALLLPFMLSRKRALGIAGLGASLWIASGLNAVRMLLFIMAFKMTTIGNAVVLLYLWPVFAMLFEGLRSKRSPSPAKAGLAALSFAGVAAMNLHRGLSLSAGDLLGSLLMILSASLFAATAIMFKAALATAREMEVLYFQNAAGAVVFLPFLIAELGGVPSRDLALGALYGLSVGLAGFGLFFFAMKRLPLFQYGALAYAEVPIGVLLGVIALGERLAISQAAGALMVVAASFLAQRLRSAPSGPSAAPAAPAAPALAAAPKAPSGT